MTIVIPRTKKTDIRYIIIFPEANACTAKIWGDITSKMGAHEYIIATDTTDHEYRARVNTQCLVHENSVGLSSSY